MIRRHRPPYSRRLAQVLARPATWPRYIGTSADGLGLTLWTLAGPQAWDLARTWAETRRLYLLAPPGEDSALYDWTTLRGHDPVLLRPCGPMTGPAVQALAAAMIRDGVRRVLHLGDRGAVRYLAPGAGEEVHHAA